MPFLPIAYLGVILYAIYKIIEDYWTQVGKEAAKAFNEKQREELERWFDEEGYKDFED